MQLIVVLATLVVYYIALQNMGAFLCDQGDLMSFLDKNSYILFF